MTSVRTTEHGIDVAGLGPRDATPLEMPGSSDLIQARGHSASPRAAPYDPVKSASPVMLKLLADAVHIASSNVPVVLLGETGVGKTWLAEYIHRRSDRRIKRLEVVDCATITPTLIESALFGHERGAFTGAVKTRRGHFEVAHEGTVLLDEIGELSPELQVKLLGVLQTQTITRLGSTEPIRVDVRVLAATNRDLERLVKQGRFRIDLYYRLKGGLLRMPPLRERRDEVPVLARHFLAKATKPGKPLGGFDPEAMALLEAYDWPGNVRELEKLVETVVAMVTGPSITAADLPEELRASRPRPAVGALHGLPRDERRVGTDDLATALITYHRNADGKRGAAVRALGLASLSAPRSPWPPQDRSVGKELFTREIKNHVALDLVSALQAAFRGPAGGAAPGAADDLLKLLRTYGLPEPSPSVLSSVGAAAPGPSAPPSARPVDGSATGRRPWRFPFFVRRDDELRRLGEALASDEEQIVCVVGRGGLGKTSLVDQYAATDAPARFPGGVVSLDAVTLAADVCRIARRFGVDGSQLEESLAHTCRHLERALDEHAVLLVVDNIDPHAISKSDLPLLHGRGRTLLVGRPIELPFALGLDFSATTIALGEWSPENCRDYYRKVAPDLGAAPDKELDDLSEVVGRLPLAVRLLAYRMRTLRERPSALLGKLQRAPIGTLDHGLSVGDRGVDATFRTSFELLEEPHRRVLLALASTARSTRCEVVAAITGLPPEDVDTLLRTLAAEAWVEPKGDVERPWALHDLVRLFLRHEPGSAAMDAAHAAHAEARCGEVKNKKTVDVDPCLPEAIVAIERLTAADPTRAWGILSAVAPRMASAGRTLELLALTAPLAVRLARDSVARSQALNRLGLVKKRMGHTAAAIALHEEGLSIARQRAGERGARLIELKHLANLGLCHRKRSLPKAIELHQQVLDLASTIKLKDTNAFVSRQFGNLGICHRRRGDIDEAIRCHERAMALLHGSHAAHDSDDEHEHAEAGKLSNLAECYRDLGELGKAISLLEQAVVLNTEHGLALGRARALSALGRCYALVGRVDEGIEVIDEALVLKQHMAVPADVAASIANLGRAHLALGDATKARELFMKALTTFEELDHLDGRAEIEGELGLCLERLGERARAADHLTRALSMGSELGMLESNPTTKALTAALERVRA